MGQENGFAIWDAATGAPAGFRVVLFGNGQFASLTADGSRRILQVSPEAWRELGWLEPDDTGTLTRWPGEIFGRLPDYAARPLSWTHRVTLVA